MSKSGLIWLVNMALDIFWQIKILDSSITIIHQCFIMQSKNNVFIVKAIEF